MPTQYRCGTARRRQAVRESTTINGIDFLEVSPDQTTLRVRLLHPLPGQPGAVPPGAPALTAENVAIRGGVRITEVRAVAVSPLDNVLAVTVNAAGDFSTYRLALVASATESAPPAGFDVQLSEVAFSFKVDCPSDFDCGPEDRCPPEILPAPHIDYLAKDYASFRRLMLDRLAVIMPGWKERNPADLGITLVELLAYVADHLSYYQDAVATEAYLGTARKRVSVRRHARLVDYFMHEGANARAWVAFTVAPVSAADGVLLPGPTEDLPGTALFTSLDGLPAVLDERDLPAAQAGAEILETMHDVILRAAHNEIHFYTWGDEDCCLPRGATRATLRQTTDAGLVHLAPGDVLIFEEVLGPPDRPKDADPGHRHAVRLTKVQVAHDPLLREGIPPQPVPIVEIAWDPEDALPFPLCLSRGQQSASVARGNVVLADHGRTVTEEKPLTAPAGRHRPTLSFSPLTHQGRVRDGEGRLIPFDPRAPAAAVFLWSVADARPAITLHEADTGIRWSPERDLLNSDRFATDFVVEIEDDGGAQLRFGDGVLGRMPDRPLTPRYRIGNGRAGNIGADTIGHVFPDPRRVAGARQMRGAMTVRNPLPAAGGIDPEPIEQVRQFAPQAFRVQERAVTEADYAAAAARHPEVQKAAATRRWTGSWYTTFVTVDRRRGLEVDAAFEGDLRAFLDRFRLAGSDLEIEGPRFVPLDIAMTICVEPGHFRSNVKRALLAAFSTADLPDGRQGFFHPDKFTFGQPVYLSKIVAGAMQVPGVAWVDITRFRRWGKLPAGELAAGRITLGRLEIARLDNDRNRPENGRIDFAMVGGL